MNNDFIAIKGLEGELKLSYKKNDNGITVSTKELVLQKPHVNYYVKLEDIISIVPFSSAGFQPVNVSVRQAAGSESCFLSDSLPKYTFFVKKAVIHNRSGVGVLGPTRLILPMRTELLEIIGEYAGMIKWV